MEFMFWRSESENHENHFQRVRHTEEGVLYYCSDCSSGRLKKYIILCGMENKNNNNNVRMN